MENIVGNLKNKLMDVNEMDEIIIKYKEKPELNNSILIEGLPGVGNVGKLAAEHLIEQLNAKKFADVFSKHFPPQVLVGNDGVIKLVNNELYYWKAKNKKQKDLVILAGDYQGLSSEGQYELADFILDSAKKLGVKTIITLGGYGLGKVIEQPRVLGASTSKKIVDKLKKLGVVFPKGEPGSGIVGASGLLLGLGTLKNLDGMCLMGETSGYFVDPKGAKAVLEILIKMLSLNISFKDLETKAAQIEKITNQLREMEKETDVHEADLCYIG